MIWSNWAKASFCGAQASSVNFEVVPVSARWRELAGAERPQMHIGLGLLAKALWETQQSHIKITVISMGSLVDYTVDVSH